MAREIFSTAGQHPDGDTRQAQLLGFGRVEIRQLLRYLVHATMLEPYPWGKVKPSSETRRPHDRSDPDSDALGVSHR
ncbi:hypothetical protein [Nocardia donostiensis]|uniref:hypothetical protein n=1 Tax=Nocardia donostiensis TaxID=1538463 RepID=UPI0020CA39F5|nr:hypothetical protein [Nocardia donostiensis]